MSELALRPGIAHGDYPERREDRETTLAQAVRSASGALSRRLNARRSRMDAFVESVKQRCMELRALDDAAMGATVLDLRRRMGVDGLTDDLVRESFALIRETARRVLGVEHYDVQLMGGWVMARGMLAEMATGEGKTLTATLPAATAALAGIPVHVLSANDYLVRRDAEAMRPLYEALGLTVGAVSDQERDPAAHRAAYACDIAYGTTSQIAFDYLRDGLARGRGRSRMQLRMERLYSDAPRGEQLLLRGLCFAIIDEADAVLIDEGRTPLILAGAGGSPEQRRAYRSALRIGQALELGKDFHLKRASVGLTERGRERAEELARPLDAMWQGARRREMWVVQALRALHVFVKDRDYLVRDGAVEIIDGPTGRPQPDRSWERGLHQLIELKEGCDPSPERETIARISCQQFFRRYLRLAGMTGTAREVAGEMWSVYRLNTVPIPTRLPLKRRDLGARVFARAQDREAALVASVREQQARGRAVLIGTCSVAESETVSRLLVEAGVSHQVLNARQDAEEAQVVAQAGQPGRVTVATNMAGRGTDIMLGDGVREAGGLHVISTQRGEARRIDRQLSGRSGRQGDPGSHQALMSLADARVVAFWPRWLLGGLARLAGPKGTLPHILGAAITILPQLSDEKEHRQTRRSLLSLEEYLGELLAFSGSE